MINSLKKHDDHPLSSGLDNGGPWCSKSFKSYHGLDHGKQSKTMESMVDRGLQFDWAVRVLYNQDWDVPQVGPVIVQP